MPNNNFFDSVNKNSILTSYNFARVSNFVFAEELTFKQYEIIKKPNHKIVHKDHRIVYIDDRINLSENDIIFCNTNYVDLLFKSLKNCELKNLKLISHQTDIPINKKFFARKPDCISEWYSINVDFTHKDLKALPLGLANYYSPKNLFYEHFLDEELDRLNKIEKIYVNFRVNTNRKVRQNILNNLESKEFCNIDNHSDDLPHYISSIASHKFVACPEGNGIDTHRLWETIYAGSIPILKNHISLKTLEELPVIFIDDFQNIDFDYILKENDKLSKKNFDKLTIEFWLNEINKNKSIENDNYSYSIPNVHRFLYLKKYKFKLFINRNLKKLMYYFLKLRKLFTVDA